MNNFERILNWAIADAFEAINIPIHNMDRHNPSVGKDRDFIDTELNKIAINIERYEKLKKIEQWIGKEKQTNGLIKNGLLKEVNNECI